MFNSMYREKILISMIGNNTSRIDLKITRLLEEGDQ